MSISSSNSGQFRVNNYDFALNLTRQIIDDKVGNVFFSPASITIVLAMCYFGAKDETKDEMKRSIFGPNVSDDDIKNWSKSVLELVNESNKFFKLKFANRIYVNQNYELKDKYVELVAAFFNSDALMVNFTEESGRIADEINDWVAQVTEQRITNLISPGTVEPTTAMLLINALYFRGVWHDWFTASKTKKQQFEVSTSETVEVDMMYLAERKGLFVDEEVQVLEMKYGHSNASMIVILPIQRHGLKNVLENLNGQKLEQWIGGIRTTGNKLEVSMPKFKIEQSINLKPVLKNLGMDRPFGELADFSEMTPKTDIKISDVIQKSFIQIDEAGTEATSATYMKMILLMHVSISNKFVADHPFLFLIMAGNGREKDILFMGKFDGKDRAE